MIFGDSLALQWSLHMHMNSSAIKKLFDYIKFLGKDLCSVSSATLCSEREVTLPAGMQQDFIYEDLLTLPQLGLCI